MSFRERYKPRRASSKQIPGIEDEGGWWDEEGVYVAEDISRLEAVPIAMHEMIEKFLVERLHVPEDKAHRVASIIERLLFVWLGRKYFEQWWEWR